MRFMMIVKASTESEAGELPTSDMLAEMGTYNEQLVEAGVLRAADGLKPSSKGAKVVFKGKKPTVIDGPFTETKELVAGFWIIDVASREEALDWARRVPFDEGEVEVRPFYETEDFASSDPTGEHRAAEHRLREAVAKKS